MMVAHNDILKDVQEIIADSLALDIEEVLPSARFFEDLGGESIDVLDVQFKCQKHFQVEVPLQNLAGNIHLETDEAGVLTRDSLDLLKKQLSFLDLSRFEQNPLKSRIVAELFTVDAIVHCVRMALEEKSQA